MPQFQSTKQLILNWLKDDNNKMFRRDFRSGKGFMVNARTKIRKKDGTIESITEVLKAHGFQDKEELDGYRVRYQEAIGEYEEAFQFFTLNPPLDAPDFL